MAMIAALGCAFAPPLGAQDSSMFKLSGFGTAAATHFSRDDIDFAGGPRVQNGAGRTRNPSFGTDSKAGLQLNFTPMRDLEFTVQAVIKETPRGDWNPTIDWANVKYSFNENAAIRVGRIGHPFFMLSDYRQVNYVNTSLRPSVEVYNLVPLTSSNVVEGLFKFNAGPGQLSLQAGFGYINDEAIPSLKTVRDHDEVEVHKLAYFNSNYEIGPWNFRVGYTQGELDYDALALRAAVFNKLTAFGGATGARLRDEWEIKDAKSSFTGLGATYEAGNIVASGEYVMLRSEKAYNDSDAWNLLAGYRIGKFTPYLSYGSVRTKDRIVVSDVAPAMQPFVGPANAAALQAGIQALANNSLKDQETTSVGVRWDFYRNMALKAQYDHIRIKDPSTQGFLVNPGRTYSARSGGNVVAVSLDFVF